MSHGLEEFKWKVRLACVLKMSHYNRLEKHFSRFLVVANSSIIQCLFSMQILWVLPIFYYKSNADIWEKISPFPKWLSLYTFLVWILSNVFHANISMSDHFLLNPNVIMIQLSLLFFLFFLLNLIYISPIHFWSALKKAAMNIHTSFHVEYCPIIFNNTAVPYHVDVL